MSHTSSQTNATHGQSLPVGTQLEEFVIERVLGSGGFGITYLARDKRLGRQVVIKENLPAQFCWRDTHALTVRARQTEGEDADNYQYSLDSFEREASTLASLDHPGIVKVLRSFEAYGTAYFVMPFVEGTALDEMIRQQTSQRNPFTETEIQDLLTKVLDALGYLHERGIYHRDIKPGNILMTKAGPVLIDFGAARQRLSERSLTVIESAGYTPFEQLQSRGKVGPWSDLYALGATLYKVLTQKTAAKAADRAFDDPLVPLAQRKELHGKFTARLLESIDKALSPQISGRFQDAGQWLAAMKSDKKIAGPVSLAPQESMALPIVPPQPPKEPVPVTQVLSEAEQHKRRKTLMEFGILLVTLTVVIGSGAGWWYGVEAPRQAEALSKAKEMAAAAVARQAQKESAANAEKQQKEQDQMAAQAEQAARVLGLSGKGVNKTAASVEELTQAFELVKANALKNHGRSMNLLGVCYEYGLGVTKNEIEAVSWYRRADEAGVVFATCNLGICYENGVGVPKSEVEAIRYYRKGAEAGDAGSMLRLGLLQKDQSQALAWYRKAAEAGNTEGMFQLGFAYGTAAGTPRDDAEAMKWFRLAADKGHVVAMYNLGLGSEVGLGMVKNEAEAVNWYRKAAELGNETAMNSLGSCYANGTGVPKDEAQAFNWYRKAAEAGDVGGMLNLGFAYEGGSGVQKNDVEAAEWYQKAAEAGDDSAMLRLGFCYEYGTGLNKDIETAVHWYNQAAEAGNTISMDKLGNCYRLGAGIPKDSHKAIEWFAKAAGGEDLHLAAKMEKLVFPQIQFQGASLEEAVEYMMVKSRDLDVTEETGIRWGVTIITAELTAKQTNVALSLDLKDVPMIEALRYIAELSGMKLKIEPQVVLLTPSS